MDDKVISTEREDLGKFEDLMIDLAEGRIAYAALSFGGFLGMGDKLFAIPWKALTMRVHEHAFVLDIPKEVLENAVGFDKDNWPATSRESLSSVYSYYGYQPYWQTETARTTDVDNTGFLRASNCFAAIINFSLRLRGLKVIQELQGCRRNSESYTPCHPI
jgi:hypothetical protein